jgi:hypothetical protein
MSPKRSFLRTMGWVYTAGFAFVVFVSHVPVFNDAQGRLFGLFQIDLRDDVVHFASAVAGAGVAWTGRALIPYFWAVALLYGADALIGMTTQQGLLDLSVFTQPWRSPDFGFKNIALNLPHIVITAVAVFVALQARGGRVASPAAHATA